MAADRERDAGAINTLRALWNAPNPGHSLISELAPVLQHRILHSGDGRRYLAQTNATDGRGITSILAALGRTPSRLLLPSSRNAAPNTALDFAILEQVDELLRLPVPSPGPSTINLRQNLIEDGETANPEAHIPLYAGFKATTPSAGKNRLARRKRRALLGEEHLGLTNSSLGLKNKGNQARGMLGAETTEVDLDFSEEEDDGFEIVGRRVKSGPSETPTRKGKGKASRRSIADLGYGHSPSKSRKPAFGVVSAVPALADREELINEVADIETDLRNLVIRRKLVGDEIDQVDAKIATLQTIRQELKRNMLGLVEEELELQDELQGVQEQLLTLELQPLSASSTATANAAATATGLSVTGTGIGMGTSRRRRGPSFLPTEHDDLPPQVAFQTLHGHTAPLTALDMSEPYGTLVTASADDDRSVRLWDLTYGEEIGRLEGHDGLVKCLQVESALCVTGGKDGRVKIWDLDRATANFEDNSSVGINAKAAPTRATSLDTVAEDEDPEPTLKQPPADSEVDESQKSCIRTLDAHTKDVTCLYFDGSCLVTGSSDKTLKQWDLTTGQCVITMDILWAISNPSASQSLSASPPTTPLRPSYPRQPQSNTSSTGSPRRPTLGGSLRRLSSQNYLLSDQYNEFDPWSETFSVPTPAYSDGSWDMYTDFVGGVQFWGYALASGSADGCVRMWDSEFPFTLIVDTDKEVRTGQAHRNLVGHIAPVTCLQFDEHYLVSGSLDKSVRVWDLRTGAIADTIRFDGPITALQFDTRKIIAAAGENGVKMYNRTTLQQDTLTINGHTSPAERLRFMDRYMATGGKDCAVKIWNLG